MVDLSRSARKLLFLVFSVCFVAFGRETSLAQSSNSGQLQLQVIDPSGAALQATGTLTGPSRQKRTYQTDAQGRITFSRLATGHYTLFVSRPGFASQTVTIDVWAT